MCCTRAFTTQCVPGSNFKMYITETGCEVGGGGELFPDNFPKCREVTF